MKQLTVFLVIVVLANFTFGLPVTKVEEKKEEKEEKHEDAGDDIEVKYQYLTKNRCLFHESINKCVKLCMN